MSDALQFDLDFTAKRPPEVQAKIEAGMRQVDANADPRWKHMWDGCVLAAARRLEELTSDDVLEEYETLKYQPGTHNLAAIGPAMRRAFQMGILSPTDRVIRSKRVEKNGNRHNVWISKQYAG